MKGSSWMLVWGIIRYELINGWRRGSLMALILSMVILPFLFNLVTTLSSQVAQVDLSLWPEQSLILHTGAAIAMNTFLLILEIFILPLLVAEIIPLDQQYRVREILSGLPLPGSIYLAGKVLSIWLIFGACSLLQAIINGVMAWIQIGPYHVEILAAFWVFGLLLLGCFSSGVAILLSVDVVNHTQAIMIGLLTAVISLGVFFILPTRDYLWSGLLISSLVQFSTPDQVARAAVFPNPFSPGYLLRIGLVILSLALLWAVSLRRVQRIRGED